MRPACSAALVFSFALCGALTRSQGTLINCDRFPRLLGHAVSEQGTGTVASCPAFACGGSMDTSPGQAERSPGKASNQIDEPRRGDRMAGDDFRQSKFQIQALEADSSSISVLTAQPSAFAFSSTGSPSTRPLRPYESRVADFRYLFLHSAHLGMALFDVEMTQHCFAEHRCREGNPIMPSSQAGQISFDLGVVACTAAGSFWARKHNVRLWWMAPAVGIAAHTAGVATGFAHR
jgi:hypothetical protein